MVEHQPSKLATRVRFSSPAWFTMARFPESESNGHTPFQSCAILMKSAEICQFISAICRY